MNSGYLLINKSIGSTSFRVVAKVRRALGVKKVGHAGTLDPLATGLLIVLVGKEYTKQADAFMAQKKRYTAEVFFGHSTTTDDAEGQTVHEKQEFSLTRDQIQTALFQFVGEIEQVPPVFSAIRIEGRRAYDLARKGQAPQMKARKITIESIDLLRFEANKAVLDVRCSKGTYIRSLARDLGAALGIPAHLSALVRTEIGSYSLDFALPEEAIFEEGRCVGSLRCASISN